MVTFAEDKNSDGKSTWVWGGGGSRPWYIKVPLFFTHLYPRVLYVTQFVFFEYITAGLFPGLSIANLQM